MNAVAVARGFDPTTAVERFGGLVWAICRRLDPDPEDAYQEVWEKVLRGRYDPAGTASPSTWIATIAHRHLVDRHRRRRVRGEAAEQDELLDTSPLAPEALSAAAGRRRLEAALAELPDAHRRVVVLHHLHELSLEEIALGEGIPVGTVKSRLHRARAALAERLA